MVVLHDGKDSAIKLLKKIKNLNDASIIAACKIVTYDVWYRNPIAAMMVKNGAKETNPDTQTIENIRTMVQRSLTFWNKFGPILADGFVFSEVDNEGNIVKSGYTATVSSGDGDYLTSDTIWDMKVTKSRLTSKHTLQILMYYIMGKHSGMDMYKGIEHLGFFNPRLNTMYLLDVADIADEIIKEVENNVICY